MRKFLISEQLVNSILRLLSVLKVLPDKYIIGDVALIINKLSSLKELKENKEDKEDKKSENS